MTDKKEDLARLAPDKVEKLYTRAWKLEIDGDSEKALGIFRSLTGYYKARGPGIKYAKSLKGLGMCESMVRNNPYAYFLLAKAKNTFLEIGDKIEAARVEITFSIPMNRTGKHRQILAMLAKTIKVLEGTNKNKRDVALCLESMGVAFHNLKKYDDAIAHYRKALEYFTGKGEKLRICHLQEKITWSLFKQGKHREAVELLSSCLGILKELKLKRFQICFHMGKNLEALGDLEGAFGSYREAVDIFETKLGHIRTDDYRETFQGDNHRVYTNFVSLALRTGRAEQAHECAQSSKARVFSELLLSDKKIELTKDNLLFARLKNLRSRVEAMETGLGGHSRETPEDLKRLYLKYEDCIREIKEKNFRKEDTAPFVALRSREIIEMLGIHEALVDYYFVKDGLAAFIFTRSGLNTVTLPLKRGELVKAIKSVAGLLSGGEPEKTALDWYMQDIYNRLFKPLEPFIANCRCVVICPHQELHRFPFCLLKNNGKYLVETFELSYIPSPSALKTLRKKGFRFSKPRDCLVVADSGKDLFWATKEAEMVAGRFRDKNRVLLEDNATLGNLSEHCPKYDILHIACHGKFNNVSPLQSYIMMSDNSGKSSKMTVSDIYQLELDNSHLVVLSSCETGLGKPTPGDEINCITRAFMQAGAPSVIVTLWEIDDESTSDLMAEFYAGILSGRTRAEALRRAQLSTLEKYPFFPRFWSPFQLVGDWR